MTMRNCLWLIFPLTMIFVSTLRADVVMNMEIPRAAYMEYEPIVVNLTMRNNSGQVLIFGKEPQFKGHMEISLTDMHNRPVKGSGTKVDLQGLILRAGVDQRIRINVSKWVQLYTPGNYRLKLFISHPMLKNEYESNTGMFQISRGRVFWTRSFGVPKLGDTANGKTEQRSYNLRALQDKGDVHLFLFVEDKENIFSMKRLGFLLGREVPKCEIDSLNRLHILLPVSPKIFHYQVFDWDGEREVNKVYRSAKQVPVLFRDTASGSVRIVGGEAAQPGVDYTVEKLLPDNLPEAEPGSKTKPAAETKQSAPQAAPQPVKAVKK